MKDGQSERCSFPSRPVSGDRRQVHRFPQQRSCFGDLPGLSGKESESEAAQGITAEPSYRIDEVPSAGQILAIDPVDQRARQQMLALTGIRCDGASPQPVGRGQGEVQG